jgi:GNAT superfamily N-acetyltransferase
VRGRAFAPGQEEHATWSAVEAAFRDLLERPPGSYARWLAMTESERREPDLWRLAEDQRDGAIVGTVLGKRFSGGGWVGGVGVRRDWRGKGFLRALSEEQEAWAYQHGFHEIVVKTKNRFYEMRGTLDNLRFEVVKFERHAADNAESKVYLSRKLDASVLKSHKLARTVVRV